MDNMEIFEEIRKIMRITNKIDDLYQKMYELELNHQKQTEEFKNCVVELEKARNKEQEIYDSCNLDTKKCLLMAQILLKDVDVYDNDLDMLINQSYDNKGIKRVLNTLNDKMLENEKNIRDLLPETEHFSLENLEKKDALKYRSFINSFFLQKEIDKDFYNLFFRLLDKRAMCEKNKVKDYLTKAKYNLCFLNKEVEKNCVNKKFLMSKELYLSSEFMAQYLNVNENARELLIDLTFSPIAIDTINKVLEISDDDYKDEEKVATAYICTSIINSSLHLMGEETVSKVHDKYQEIINEKFKDKIAKYKPEEFKIISVSNILVHNCFRNNKKEIYFTRKLTLKDKE